MAIFMFLINEFILYALYWPRLDLHHTWSGILPSGQNAFL